MALEACLAALAVQSLPPLEVLVVLRDGDEASRAIVDLAGEHVRSATVDRPGMVAALNRGRELARGDIIAFTDDDAQPHQDWLQRVADLFASDPTIGAVGGRDFVHYGARTQTGSADPVGRVRWWGRRIGNHHLGTRIQDVDFLKGVNMAVRVEALRPFDDRLRGDGAQVAVDLEATWSIRRRGWRVVYDPAIAVQHYPAPRHDDDTRQSPSMRAVLNAEHNDLYALLRHAAWWHRPVLFTYAFLVGKRATPGPLLAALPGIPPGRRSHVARYAGARLAALVTLLRR